MSTSLYCICILLWCAFGFVMNQLDVCYKDHQNEFVLQCIKTWNYYRAGLLRCLIPVSALSILFFVISRLENISGLLQFFRFLTWITFIIWLGCFLICMIIRHIQEKHQHAPSEQSGHNNPPKDMDVEDNTHIGSDSINGVSSHLSVVRSIVWVSDFFRKRTNLRWVLLHVSATNRHVFSVVCLFTACVCVALCAYTIGRAWAFVIASVCIAVSVFLYFINASSDRTKEDL